MFTLAKIHSGQRKGGGALVRKRIWLRTLVLAGLGAMGVTVLCLLPGCGSDSTPGGSVKGKNAATATSPKPKKMQGSISLLVDKEETGPGKMGTIKHQPEANLVEPIPGVTREEMEAKAAAERKIFESPDSEVFPGMTKAKWDERIEAERKSFDPKTAEVFPGMTKAQWDDRLEAERKNFDPKKAAVFPGMTKAKLEAQNAKQKVKPDDRELFPPAVGK
jgi:hypothetical protein